MVGLSEIYDKLKYILSGTGNREVFRDSFPTDEDFYHDNEKSILEKAKLQREAQKLALQKAEEKKRVNQASQAINQVEVVSDSELPEKQIEFGTLPPGSGNSLRRAEIDGISKRTLNQLFNARKDKPKSS